MNFMVFLQQSADGGAANWSFLVMMGLIFVVMYFFMIRPQQKKQKELANFRNSLSKGDKVVTIGGIYGTISEVREKDVILEVDNAVKIRVDKSAVIKDIADLPERK